MAKEFDLIVIGAGPGGYVSAIRAAQEGLHVALVERRDVGGTCLNRGCVPTKALLHAAQLYQELLHSQSLGIHVTGLSYDIRELYSRKDSVVTQLRQGVELLLRENKVELLRGAALVAGEKTVQVEQETLTAPHILIATGAEPSRPPIPGLDLPGVLTSGELLEQAGTDYKSLVILGGGVIGMEFAAVFSALGCAVTVLEAADRILPTMEREIAQNLSMIMKKRGVSIQTASLVERVEQSAQGLCCTFTSKGKPGSVTAEAVLVATGRKANIDGLFAPGAEPKFERGIVVDEHFQSSLPGVYAIGDVIAGGIQLAHVASAQGCCAVAHMLGKEPEIDLNVVPACIYTEPEIATVGLSEAKAKELGRAVKTAKYSMAGNGRSIIAQQERGFVKLVFDAQTQVVLGAQLMCARATDLIGELTTAIVNGLTVCQLAAVIRPHPTFGEGIGEAVESALGKAIHMAPKR